MKHFILIATLLAANIANASGTQFAELNRFFIDSKSKLSNANSGFVTVKNYGKNPSIRLVLENRCIATNDEPVCLMGIQTLLDTTLKITGVKKDSCGAVIYTASQNIPDNSKIITVTDSTNNICESVAAITPTEVTYETYGIAGRMISATMTGSALKFVDTNKPNDEVKTEIQPMSY